MATEVIEVIETAVEVVEVLTQGPQGLQGPQGPQGSAASVVYGTTAGTATQGNDSRIATIGSGTINTSTTNGEAGSIITSDNGGGNTGGYIDTSASDYNGGNIQTSGGSNAVGGSISTYDGGGSINTRGTGSIELGATGTRTTLNGSAATTDKTITLPNATGTVALTQQATDYEITNSSAGIIMKSPNNSRWRITIDNNGVLLRTALTLLFSLSFMCGARAQVRDLVYCTNNVVIGPTNGNALSFTNSIAFSNPISFGTNAATTRTNLGLGWSALTNTNSATSLLGFTTNGQVVANTGTNVLTLTDRVIIQASNISNVDVFTVIGGGNNSGFGNQSLVIRNATVSGTNDLVPAGFELSFAGLNFSSDLAKTTTLTNLNLGWSALTNTNAINFRTAIGVTVASNLPAPYSGAAASNSLLTADGVGGSSFVANRLSVSGLTTNVVRTSWANVGADKTTNDTGLSLSYAANNVYRFKWSVFVSSTWSNVAYGIAFSGTNSFSVRNGYQVTPSSSTPSSAAIAAGVTNTTLVNDSTSSYPAPTYVGGEIVFFSTNAGTLNFRFWTTASNTNTSTLFSNSIITLEKLYP